VAKRYGRDLVDMEGFGALQIKLRTWWGSTEDKVVEKALLDVAEKMQARARSRVPYKTGDLQKSIVAKVYGIKRPGNPAVFLAIDRKVLQIDWSEKSSRAQIFWRQYAMEEGNRRVPAQPYFRNSVDAYRHTLGKHVNRAVRKANKARAGRKK